MGQSSCAITYRPEKSGFKVYYISTVEWCISRILFYRNLQNFWFFFSHSRNHPVTISNLLNEDFPYYLFNNCSDNGWTCMQDGQESVSYVNVPMAEIYHTSVLGNFLEDLKANWKTETQMTWFLVFPTAWNMSKYGVFSSPYFPVFGLNKKIFSVNLFVQSKYGKTRTRKNFVFGNFSHSVSLSLKDHPTSLFCLPCWVIDT